MATATQFALRPQQYTYGVAPAQVDFSQILNLLIPIMGLALIMGMMMPMMRSMSEAFAPAK